MTLRRARGVAAVEFAFVLPVLLAVAFGIVELGRAMYEYDTLVKSARAAVRYLTTVNVADPAMRNRAVCIALAADPYASCYGSTVNMTARAPWMLGTLAASDVEILWPNPSDPALAGLYNINTGQGGIDLVTVVIRNYRYRSFLLPFVPAIGTFGPISATMAKFGA
jgi:predicted outer membrane lipoprotein